MRKISNIVIIGVGFAISGCAGYQFGDLSTAYCEETDPILKKALKKQIHAMGVVLPVDYCLTRMVVKGANNARVNNIDAK